MSYINTEQILKSPENQVGGKAVESRSGLKSGMTLIELLIVVAITVITIGVVFTLYRLSITHYARQDARLEQTQNMRVALFSIARDIRMAGNFYPILGPGVKLLQGYVPNAATSATDTDGGWFEHEDTDQRGIRAIFGTDGEKTAADTLTIMRSEIETSRSLGSGAVKGINAAFIPGQESMTFNGELPAGSVEVDDIIAIADGTRAALFIVEAVGGDTLRVVTGRERFNSVVGVPAFQTGSMVYNLRDVTLVTYYLDTTRLENGELANNLMATYHDGDPPIIVATNIEDFQVNFFVEGDIITHSPDTFTPLTAARADDNPVIGVNVGLVSRSAYGDNKEARYKRPGLINRDPASEDEKDDHYRAVLVETVVLRNALFNR